MYLNANLNIVSGRIQSYFYPTPIQYGMEKDSTTSQIIETLFIGFTHREKQCRVKANYTEYQLGENGTRKMEDLLTEELIHKVENVMNGKSPGYTGEVPFDVRENKLLLLLI